VSETKSELAAALAAAQAEIRDPERNKSGQVRGRSGYRYAGLDDLLRAIRPVLARHGLAVTQPIEVVEGQPCLVTQLRHASGEVVCSTWPLAWPNGAQERGSELTYARRYTLEGLVGVAATDDDDGEEEPAPRQRPQPAQRRDTPPPSPSPTSGAAEPASGGGQRGHHPSWEADKRPFFAAVGALTDPKLPDYAEWAAWCEEHTWPRRDGSPATGRPSSLPKPDREALYQWLRNPDHRRQVLEWAARQSAGEAA
jgi:hypothetical protein